MKKTLITLIVLALIGGGFYYVLDGVSNPMDPNDTTEISFTVEKGETLNSVAKKLAYNDLVKFDLIFTQIAKNRNLDTAIKAGTYKLSRSMTPSEILDVITTASSSELKLVVQEGLTISQIDDKLLNLGVIEDNEFEQAVRDFDNYDLYWFLDRDVQKELDLPLEGYLYPDTYFIDEGDFSAAELVEIMLRNFEGKFEVLVPDLHSQDRTMHEIVTMASILQREVRTPEDFNIVSGILWKRLDSNWHLGADATILYITKKNKITAADLEIDDPYNTRLHVGMPPGPICNPDINHLRAALNPEDSDYWYYLTTLDTGEVIYARDNDEHNINKAKYL